LTWIHLVFRDHAAVFYPAVARVRGLRYSAGTHWASPVTDGSGQAVARIPDYAARW
jgi:hypothetical protein